MEDSVLTNKLSEHCCRGREGKGFGDLDLIVNERTPSSPLDSKRTVKTTTARSLNCIAELPSRMATVKGYNILREKTDLKRDTSLLAESYGLSEKLGAHEFLRFTGALYTHHEETWR